MIIVTDSAADLPQEEVKALGIHVAPLLIQFPEGEVSAEDLTPDEFYRKLKAMEPEIPTTSLPSSGYFADLYRRLGEKKEEILSIHISSGLSGTIESARVGAKDAAGVVVHHIDTLTLSGGERFQVLAAAQAAKLGASKDAIAQKLEQIRLSTEVIYTLETLTYLARGGRIGRVQALAGSILRVKPIIHVDKKDGKYSTVGKERTITRSIEHMRDHLVELYGSKQPLWVSVLHGQFAEPANNMAEVLKKSLNAAKLEILRISPVLGVHTGPGIVGTAVVPMELMEESA